MGTDVEVGREGLSGTVTVQLRRKRNISLGGKGAGRVFMQSIDLCRLEYGHGIGVNTLLQSSIQVSCEQRELYKINLLTDGDLARMEEVDA